MDLNHIPKTTISQYYFIIVPINFKYKSQCTRNLHCKFLVQKGQQKFDEYKQPIIITPSNYQIKKFNRSHLLNFFLPIYNQNRTINYALKLRVDTLIPQLYLQAGEFIINSNTYIEAFISLNQNCFHSIIPFCNEWQLECEIYLEHSRQECENNIRNQRRQIFSSKKKQNVQRSLYKHYSISAKSLLRNNSLQPKKNLNIINKINHNTLDNLLQLPKQQQQVNNLIQSHLNNFLLKSFQSLNQNDYRKIQLQETNNFNKEIIQSSNNINLDNIIARNLNEDNSNKDKYNAESNNGHILINKTPQKVLINDNKSQQKEIINENNTKGQSKNIIKQTFEDNKKQISFINQNQNNIEEKKIQQQFFSNQDLQSIKLQKENSFKLQQNDNKLNLKWTQSSLTLSPQKKDNNIKFTQSRIITQKCKENNYSNSNSKNIKIIIIGIFIFIISLFFINSNKIQLQNQVIKPKKGPKKAK